MKRRDFIKGLGGLFLAPAIVKAENIMRINPVGVIMPRGINAWIDSGDENRWHEAIFDISPQETPFTQIVEYETDLYDPAVLDSKIIQQIDRRTAALRADMRAQLN